MKLGKTMIKIMIWHLNDANKLFSLYFLFGGGGFPGNLVVKNLPANAGDTGLTPGWGRSPGSQSEQQNKTQAPFPGSEHCALFSTRVFLETGVCSHCLYSLPFHSLLNSLICDFRPHVLLKLLIQN